MPDYAETELMANELHTALSGCVVVSVSQSDWYAKRTKGKDLPHIVGWKVNSVTRVGKALLFSFEKPRYGNKFMANRLGMSGRWRIYSADYNFQEIKGWGVIFIVEHDQGRIALVYTDPRRFGTIEIAKYAHEIESLRVYGPEIRSSQFTKEWVEFCCARHNTAIKELLLRQQYFPGVGNWMASEILFSANINPLAKANQLSKQQIRRLFEAIHLIMNNAISQKIYGGEDDMMNVFARENRLCRICRTSIVKVVIGKRGTYYCPSCQSPDWSPPKGVSSEYVDKVCKEIEGLV